MNCQKQPFCALYIKQRQKKKKKQGELIHEKSCVSWEEQRKSGILPGLPPPPFSTPPTRFQAR